MKLKSAKTATARAKSLRPIAIERGVNPYAEGSCLIRMGQTHVLATASVETTLPPWLRGKGRGWVTAEYAMLPRANRERTPRERSRPSGRSQEIQRLIGRSLRAICDLPVLGEMQIVVDCDVLQADGGTRCASINAGYIALADAVAWCLAAGKIARSPLVDSVAAVSVALVDGLIVTDPDYAQDSAADVDANFVVTGKGRLVEIQMSGEEATFGDDDLAAMLAAARTGVKKIAREQAAALRKPLAHKTARGSR